MFRISEARVCVVAVEIITAAEEGACSIIRHTILLCMICHLFRDGCTRHSYSVILYVFRWHLKKGGTSIEKKVPSYVYISYAYV